MNDYAVLVSLAGLPIGLWLLACLSMPRHTWLITGIAFGLVVNIVIELLRWLFFDMNVFFQAVIAILMLIHIEPALIFEHLLGIHAKYDTPGIYFYLPLGVFWAVIYGYIGFRVDRSLLARSRKTRQLE